MSSQEYMELKAQLDRIEAILSGRPVPSADAVPSTALTSFRQRCNEALAREAQARARKAERQCKRS